ncbi:hypothetical protein [Enterococcus gilvus]|uniref:hypothetical protein n=1 Tax=Enterococcus gilvus TaxID=160453 RepID=UPI001C8B1235|nr:hypothetical protein [Enterococcus gilvus]MBX8935564.1 hypothetical protein [Enterococcus gilvus]
MKEKLKAAKQKMKNDSRPYNTYGYYLGLPIIFIVLMIIPFLGIDIGRTAGHVLFVFTILAHIGASKLKLVSRRKHVAPSLLYFSNIVSLLLIPIIFLDFTRGGAGETYFVILGLILTPIQILMIIFFFISANDIKKAYPTMKQDARISREDYLMIKKSS